MDIWENQTIKQQDSTIINIYKKINSNFKLVSPREQ